MIIIIDFGSQYTQLIARRIRELEVYSEILPYNKLDKLDLEKINGIILSGGPDSKYDSPIIDDLIRNSTIPILGICYGAQLIAKKCGCYLSTCEKREYGKVELELTQLYTPLFRDIPMKSAVWMSHGDTIELLDDSFINIARTSTIKNAAYKVTDKPIYGLQFHPEVSHSEYGVQMIKNFVFKICKCSTNWKTQNFIEDSIIKIRETIGNDKVIMAISGGVDSTVTTTLIHKAIGDNLVCVLIDNGLMRLNECDEVVKYLGDVNIKVNKIDASERFIEALQSVIDPEKKRKVIGNLFIKIFEETAMIYGKCENNNGVDIKWLAQGTIYPDVIESPIKSHHNVGGLPEKMNLKIVEPIRTLFKDEVRRLGYQLGLPAAIIGRHPFPGPGLAIRILGNVDREKLDILRRADHILTATLREFGLYDDVWQAAAILLPFHTVGVQGDNRTYGKVISLRLVNSSDGMTANWSKMPYEFLEEVSNRITNGVKEVNRVVYDISSKPPATIEYE